MSYLHNCHIPRSPCSQYGFCQVICGLWNSFRDARVWLSNEFEWLVTCSMKLISTTRVRRPKGVSESETGADHYPCLKLKTEVCICNWVHYTATPLSGRRGRRRRCCTNSVSHLQQQIDWLMAPKRVLVFLSPPIDGPLIELRKSSPTKWTQWPYWIRSHE